MRTVIRIVVLCGSLVSMPATPLLAAGPIDGEVSALWWANDLDTSSQAGNTSDDGGAPGLRAELWALERYGVRAAQFGSDVRSSQGADYTSIDVMWKALAPTENNFLALGLGWQRMQLEGLAGDTSGMRLAVEGRVALAGMIYAYGTGSYLPDLEDAAPTTPGASTLEDMDAYEYELGVAWNAMPFMNVHAGYRVNNLSFSQETIQLTSLSPGVMIPEGQGQAGISDLGPKPPTICPECQTNATAGDGSTGELESSGFYVGLGFRF